MNTKYILLDCDGVLYDKEHLSLREIQKALQDACQSLGIDKSMRQEALSLKKSSNITGMVNYMHLICKLSNISFDVLANKHVELTDYSRIEQDDYLFRRLMKLKEFGYKFAIASNNHKQHIENILTHLSGDLWKKLNIKIFHGSSFKHENAYLKKPQKEFYEAVIRGLNCPPENIAFFDDDKQNVEDARSVGIDAWFEPTPEHWPPNESIRHVNSEIRNCQLIHYKKNSQNKVMTLEDFDREMFRIIKEALSFLKVGDKTYQEIYNSYQTLLFSDYHTLETALTGIINLEEEHQDSAHWMLDAYFPELCDDDRFIYDEFNDFISEEILKLGKIYR